MSAYTRNTLKAVLMAFFVTIGVGCILLRIAESFGLGPHWVEYRSPSGIPYACMYPSEQDFIDITYDHTEDHYHDDSAQTQR